MATAKIVLSKVSTSSTTTTYTVKYNLLYYGNGVSYNSGACKYTISATGQTAKTGVHPFTTSTSPQTIGTATFTWNKSTSATTKTISASFVTGVSLGTLKATTTITVPALPSYTVSFTTNSSDYYGYPIDNVLYPINNMPNSQSLSLGTRYSLPTNINRVGYKFNGWRNKASGNTVTTVTVNQNLAFEAQWTPLLVSINVPENNPDPTLGVEEVLFGICFTGAHVSNPTIRQILDRFVHNFTRENNISEFVSDDPSQYFTLTVQFDTGVELNFSGQTVLEIIDRLYIPKTSTVWVFDLDILYRWYSSSSNGSITSLTIAPVIKYKEYTVIIEDANSTRSFFTCRSMDTISSIFNNVYSQIADTFTDENGFTYILDKDVVQDVSVGRANIAPFNDFTSKGNTLMDGFIYTDTYVMKDRVLKACYTKQPQFITTPSDINYMRLNKTDYDAFIQDDFDYQEFNNFNLNVHNEYIGGYVGFYNEYDSNYSLKTYYADYASIQVDKGLSGKYTITVDDIPLIVEQQFIGSSIFIKFYSAVPILPNIEKLLNISLTELKTTTGYHINDFIRQYTLPSAHTLLHINGSRTKINLGYENADNNTDYEINTTIPVNFINDKNTVIHSSSTLNTSAFLTDLVPGTYYIGDDIRITFNEDYINLSKGDIMNIIKINNESAVYYLIKTDLTNGKTIFRVIS